MFESIVYFMGGGFFMVGAVVCMDPVLLFIALMWLTLSVVSMPFKVRRL